MASSAAESDAATRRAAPRIAELVADQMRRQIIEGKLADGTVLPRLEELVKRYNVTLVALREALRILETEGLISVRRGNQGGVVVHAPNETYVAYMLSLVLQCNGVELGDLGLTLRELEPSCAALAAARPDRSAISVQLTEINNAMAGSLEDPTAFSEIGRQFHYQLVRASGNSTMIAVVGILETLWIGHEQLWAEQTTAAGSHPSLAERQAALRVHERITDAIEAGEPDHARRVAARHLHDTQSHLLSTDSSRKIYAVRPWEIPTRPAF
jgi:GntR family transcriptional regulator, transcriptional repressor for pyruvate dehydrogenase complex